MTKKKTMVKSEEFSFLAMDKSLSKIKGFEMGSLLEENTFSEIDEWIPTGNYLLSAQISGSLFGGVANSRSLGLMGDPGTAKTFLCLNIAREAQKMGYNIIYCDTEGAVDKKTMLNFGIDPTKVRYQPVKTVTTLMHFITNILDMVKSARVKGQNPKILLIVDSLGMLSTDKELKDAIEGKNAGDMGLKAKELRKLFRAITIDLTAAKVSFIGTNHIYTGGGAFIPTKESSGGMGPIFAMSVVSFLSIAQLKEGNATTKTGVIVTSNLKKSRFTVPEQIKFHISFANGMNPYVGLENFVSWEACGIGKGKFEEIKNKEGKNENIFVPSDSPHARWAVKHLDKTITSSQLFTKEVFTPEVLKELDENIIKPHFKFAEIGVDEEIVNMLEASKKAEENNE